MGGRQAGRQSGGGSLEGEDDDEARSPNRRFCLSLSCFCTFLIFADVSGAGQVSLASSDDAAAWDFGTGSPTLKPPNLQASKPPNHKTSKPPSMQAMVKRCRVCHPSGFPVVLGRHLHRCNPPPPTHPSIRHKKKQQKNCSCTSM